MRYRFVGGHAHEFAVGDTRVQAGTGDFIELDDDFMKDPANEEVVPFLLEAPEPAEEKSVKATTTSSKEVSDNDK